MSRYALIRRLYGPAFLLLVGVNALLNQADILDWGKSWPFYLILWGVLKLAERAALASEGYPQWPGAPQQGWPQGTQSPYPSPQPPAAQPTQAAEGQVIPTIPVEIVKENKGGQQ